MDGNSPPSDSLFVLVWITPPFEDAITYTYAISKLHFFMRKSCSYPIFRIAILNEIIHVASRVALLDGGVVNLFWYPVL